jgi:hypothetical protein
LQIYSSESFEIGFGEPFFGSENSCFIFVLLLFILHCNSQDPTDSDPFLHLPTCGICQITGLRNCSHKLFDLTKRGGGHETRTRAARPMSREELKC